MLDNEDLTGLENKFRVNENFNKIQDYIDLAKTKFNIEIRFKEE